jgi:glycosyltransferase involved in cell wall biosynthesis
VRILYVVTRADAVGGASIHVRDMGREMIGRGHTVLVLTGGEGPVTDLLQAAGVPYHPLRSLRRSIHPVRDFLAARQLAAAVREFAPDLMSLHTAKAGWIGRAVAARLGIPSVYTPHGWPVGDRIGRRKGVLPEWAEKAASGWTSAIICVCEYERNLALHKRLAREDRLHVVHNGVLDISAGLRADAGAVPPRIVSVARLEAPKDPVTLFSALGTIRSQPWELDLVGDGPLEPELRRLAASTGIADRVRFLGYVREPAEALARAQLFVLSSRSEGFPRSVLEAMRAGLPVVATAVGGIPEAITDGIEGLLVPRGDPSALAGALSGLLTDGERRKQMAMRARHTYEERFRFERMADETEAVYAKMLVSRARGSGSR